MKRLTVVSNGQTPDATPKGVYVNRTPTGPEDAFLDTEELTHSYEIGWGTRDLTVRRTITKDGEQIVEDVANYQPGAWASVATAS